MRSLEVNMKVDEWEAMKRDNELLPDREKKEIPKLEEITIHNWQPAAIGALHKVAEAHLLGNLFKKIKCDQYSLMTKQSLN